jgi:hypothetical protein
MKGEKMGIHRDKRNCQKGERIAPPIVAIFVKESVPGKQQKKHYGSYNGEQQRGRNAPEQACG